MDPTENAALKKSRKRRGSEATESVTSTPDYQDFRDDRVHTFFNLKPGESKRYRFFLHAAYLGEFHLPTSLVEAMYDAAIQSRTESGKVVVRVSEGSNGDPDAPTRLQSGEASSEDGSSGEEGGESQGEDSNGEPSDGEGDQSEEQSGE
jgi:Bacterial Alpha-2-macroglobulin MG10 domain